MKKLSTPLAGRGYSALTLQGRKTNEQSPFTHMIPNDEKDTLL